MIAKEKAIELANKFVTKSVFEMDDFELQEERRKAKNAALICADEIINQAMEMDGEFFFEFWENVKGEIYKL